MFFFYVFTYKMNRRDQPEALRRAPAISRELKAILKAGAPVILGGRRLRSNLQLNYPAQVQAAQVLAAQAQVQAQLAAPEEQKGPPDEGKYEDEGPDEGPDFGDIQLGQEEDPMQQLIQNAERDYQDILSRYERMLQLRQRTARYRNVNIIEEELKAADAWGDKYLAQGVPQNIIDGIVDRNIANYPLLRQELQRVREEQENKESAEIQAKRDRWAELEEQGETIPRNTWLSGGVRVLREVGLEPPVIWSGLPIVAREMPAIAFVDKFWVKPQIKDWNKCQQCAFILENGEQCKREASCHRDNPSNTYCWEHARASGLNYQHRIGLV